MAKAVSKKHTSYMMSSIDELPNNEKLLLNENTYFVGSYEEDNSQSSDQLRIASRFQNL